jgi:hypothetical protein
MMAMTLGEQVDALVKAYEQEWVEDTKRLEDAVTAEERTAIEDCAELTAATLRNLKAEVGEVIERYDF